jgi:prepilin-type processing-associated H-X9-DG protein
VQHVTGQPGVPRPPLSLGSPGDMTTKIVLGDWNWHPNRPLSNARTQWHGTAKRRQMNMLFADGHAELFTFPDEYEQSPNVDSYDYDPKNPGADVKPDPARGYW